MHAELNAAQEIAKATVLNNFRRLRDRPDRNGVLRGLVHIFDGSRNIRAVLYDSAPGTRGVATAGSHDIIVLDLSARDETSKVWANISDNTLFVVLFVGVSLLLGWRLIGWILAPVAKLASGIADLRAGRTAGPRERRSLVAAFNGLVRDLAARAAEARQLRIKGTGFRRKSGPTLP